MHYLIPISDVPKWEEYRAQWIKHHDAVQAFREKIGAEEVRTDFTGCVYSAAFRHGGMHPKGFSHTLKHGHFRLTKDGIKMYADDNAAIRALFPSVLPAPFEGVSQTFDLNPVWASGQTPIYLHHRTSRFSMPDDYTMISKEEFDFRHALDVFSVSDDRTRVNIVLNDLVLGDSGE